MAIIKEVTLSNFRGFKRLSRLRLAPITFLVGPNSAGKSSIADALLFMAQSGFLSLSATNLMWIGPLVDLGSFKETVFGHQTSYGITINIRVDNVQFTQLHRSDRPKTLVLNVNIAAEIRTAKAAPEGRLKKLSIRLADSKDGAELVRRRGRYESFDAKAGDRRVEHDPREPWSSPAKALSSVLYGEQDQKRVSPLSDLLSSLGLDDYAASIQRVSSGRNPPKRSYSRIGGGSHAKRIGLNDMGDFTEDWPDGFFDERYHETMKIAEAQARRSAE